MPTIAGAQVPPPKSWDEFEEIVLSAAKLRWKHQGLYRHGRQGQRQDGVDVFGTDSDGKRIGMQCKNTLAGVSQAVAESEIANAESFVPSLEALYIVTSAATDAPTQKFIRQISKERRESGKFPVEILFWNDVYQDLAKDDDEFFKHFPQFRRATSQSHDKQLFDELTALLSSDGVIGFVNKTNMAGFSFEADQLTPLWNFYERWNSPERRFLNADLDAARGALWKKAGEYYEAILTHTFATRTAGRLSVPPEWEDEQPERFRKIVAELHGLAGEIVKLHADFISIGKRELSGI